MTPSPNLTKPIKHKTKPLEPQLLTSKTKTKKSSKSSLLSLKAFSCLQNMESSSSLELIPLKKASSQKPSLLPAKLETSASQMFFIPLRSKAISSNPLWFSQKRNSISSTVGKKMYLLCRSAKSLKLHADPVCQWIFSWKLRLLSRLVKKVSLLCQAKVPLWE